MFAVLLAALLHLLLVVPLAIFGHFCLLAVLWNIHGLLVLERGERAVLEELALVRRVHLERQLGEEHHVEGSLLHCEDPIVLGHVSIHEPRAQRIHLDLSVNYLGLPAQHLGEMVDPYFGNGVAPFGPSLVEVGSILHIRNKLLHQLNQLLSVQVRILEPFSEFRAYFVKFTCRRANNDNFSLVLDELEHLVCEGNSPIEILN